MGAELIWDQFLGSKTVEERTLYALRLRFDQRVL
jgi:hypothetical protein